MGLRKSYNPPEVGYAETSSATEHLAIVSQGPHSLAKAIQLTAMHIQPAPEISQHHTAAAEPPAESGKMKVVMIVANKPLILTAKEKVDR